jgi:ribosomal protein L16/L10AE
LNDEAFSLDDILFEIHIAQKNRFELHAGLTRAKMKLTLYHLA